MMERQEMHSEGAILAVDVVGYSRLMGKDEEATLRRLHDYRGLIQDLVTGHGGRVFGVAGDSEMAVFTDARDAVCCALAVQETTGKRDALLPKDSRMPVRVGVNFGRVIMEADGVYGDDVNIAARLESFAEAGEVCISGAVFERVKGRLDCGFDCFGEERFKNIAQPVRVYRVRTDPEATGQVVRAKRRRPKPGRIWRLAAAASLAALLGATAWGVNVQVEKRRAEAAAAKLVTAAQTDVAEVEGHVERLLKNLRQAEALSVGERERGEALLATLRETRDRARESEQAALDQASQVRNLLDLLRASEARAEAEQQQAETLLADLEEAESQVAAARNKVELVKETRRGAERAMIASLLSSWHAAEQQAAVERARAEALLETLQNAEARAEAAQQEATREATLRQEAEQQAARNRQQAEELLATLKEAHAFAAAERVRTEDLYGRVQKARLKAVDSDEVAQQLDGEASRIEALLATLREAETRIAGERARAQDMLEALQDTRQAAPDTLEQEGMGKDDWQDARIGARERAEILLVTWIDAEQAATAERQRAEDLLTSLEAERAPPPVPLAKPAVTMAVESVAEDSAPGTTLRNLPETDNAGRVADNDVSLDNSPSEIELAHNLEYESLVKLPTDGIRSFDGSWVARDGPWTAKLEIRDGRFRLEARCESEPRPAGGTATGRLEAGGRIPPMALRTIGMDPASIGGTLTELTITYSKNYLCPRARLRFERRVHLAPAGSLDGRLIIKDGFWHKFFGSLPRTSLARALRPV